MGNEIEDLYSKGDLEIMSAGNADVPANLDEDSLGFKPYVEGVYSYLINPETKSPFTLSIEGGWGMGKSSFMDQLESTLKTNKNKTVRFNAWRQDKVENMWAAFAISFMDEMFSSLSWCNRLSAFFSLRWHRFEWKKGWFQVLKTLIISLVYCYITYILFKNGLDLDKVFVDGKVELGSIAKVIGQAGWLFAMPLLFKQISEVLGNPFKIELEKYVNSPKYDGNVTFIEEFHKDFKTIIKALTSENEKVFVFIDDLDRAEVPKAAELMQGLNMMLLDSPRIVFIIGMDREKVAAGVAFKYKDIVPLLHPEDSGNVVKMNRNIANYGYKFAEKFIQLSFQLPRPSTNFTRKYIDSLSGISPNSTQQIQYRPVLTLKHGKDAELFRVVTEQLAVFFNYNPRRIKQFVNSFRLKAHIANSTGLFIDRNNSMMVPLTLPQLGKFVAISMIWPQFIKELSNTPNLLELYFENSIDDEIKKWKEDKAFGKLLNFNPLDILSSNAEWELHDVNFLPLLETTPPYKSNPQGGNSNSGSIGTNSSPVSPIPVPTTSGTTTTTTLPPYPTT